jgi:hypothetical protein
MVLLKAHNSWGSGSSPGKTFTHIPSAVCSLSLIQQPSPKTLHSPIRPTCASVLSGCTDSVAVAAIVHLAPGFEALRDTRASLLIPGRPCLAALLEYDSQPGSDALAFPATNQYVASAFLAPATLLTPLYPSPLSRVSLSPAAPWSNTCIT